MQLSTVFTILVTVITAVTATLNPTVDARDYTNGERMARHLPPKPPMRRGASTPVYGMWIFYLRLAVLFIDFR